MDPKTNRQQKSDLSRVKLEPLPTHEKIEQSVTIPEGIFRGEQAIQAGRIVSHKDAKERMKRWLS